MIRLLILFIALSLSSCSSLELRNLGKSGASAGIAYAINPLAGVATLATAMAYDEIVPDSPEVADIETKEQAVAFVATSWGKDALYGFLAFLLITNVAVPWITRRQGYKKAKDKYKADNSQVNT
jgi:hypothetical protein